MLSLSPKNNAQIKIIQALQEFERYSTLFLTFILTYIRYVVVIIKVTIIYT